MQGLRLLRATACHAPEGAVKDGTNLEIGRNIPVRFQPGSVWFSCLSAVSSVSRRVFAWNQLSPPHSPCPDLTSFLRWAGFCY